KPATAPGRSAVPYAGRLRLHAHREARARAAPTSRIAGGCPRRRAPSCGQAYAGGATPIFRRSAPRTEAHYKRDFRIGREHASRPPVLRDDDALLSLGRVGPANGAGAAVALGDERPRPRKRRSHGAWYTA